MHEIIQILLSVTSEIFIDVFFTRLLHGLKRLHQTVELLGSAAVPESYIERLHISDSKKNNKRIKLHVWLCKLMEVESNYCIEVI